ncbi:MAG: uroporphyrinogen decarboxylase family protein [Anaerolineales bacterium]
MSQKYISHRQRIENCLSGQQLDRPPVALWRHFPVDDQHPDSLASAHLHFQKTYDFDLVKVTPASSFCLRDWGIMDEWRGATEGTREYVSRVIHKPDDWDKLPILNPSADHLASQLACLRILVKELGQSTPIIQTIFNPLSQAKNLVGSNKLLVHIRRYPEQFHTGLETIARSTRRFVEAALETGIAGVFFAVQHAQFGLLSVDEFDSFGRHYDLQVLEPAQNAWLNVLHLHGGDVMFKNLIDYPVSVINWHDRETEPTLADAQTMFPGVVCGGLSRLSTIVLGTPSDVYTESEIAIRDTNSSRFILGTGCVTPINAPHGNLLAVRQSVEK